MNHTRYAIPPYGKKKPFDNLREPVERTDPDYIDKIDRRNLQIYFSLKTAADRQTFIEGLTGAERRTIRERLFDPYGQQLLQTAIGKLPVNERSVLSKVLAAVPLASIAKEARIPLSEAKKYYENALRKIEELEDKPISSLQAQPVEEKIQIELGRVNKALCGRLARNPDLLYEIAPREFEVLVAELIKDMGASHLELTKQTRDGGRDIIARFDSPLGPFLATVECKRYSPKRTIGIELVERLLFVMDRKDVSSMAILATTSYFSADARRLEEEYRYRLHLHDVNVVVKWLKRYGTWTKDESSGLYLKS